MGGRAGGGASGGMGSGSRSARAVAEAEKELGFSLKGMSKEDQKFWIQQAKDNKAWKKDFEDRTGKSRTPFEKGSEGYKNAQQIANILQNSADTSWKGYSGQSLSKSLAGSDWDSAADRVKWATDFVSKKGNDFEKSVAASIAKTIRPSGKGSKVAFVSSKQAWVLGKAMSEMHVKPGDFSF